MKYLLLALLIGGTSYLMAYDHNTITMSKETYDSFAACHIAMPQGMIDDASQRYTISVEELQDAFSGHEVEWLYIQELYPARLGLRIDNQGIQIDLWLEDDDLEQFLRELILKENS